MVEQGELARDLAGLVVPLAGRLVATGDRWEPYRLLGSDGVSVEAAGASTSAYLPSPAPPAPPHGHPVS